MTRLIAPGAWRTVPWANGRGLTHEVWREPDTDAWELRISVADIDGAQPFSHLPGVWRWLTPLRPSSLQLTIAGTVAPLTPGQLFAFTGTCAAASVGVGHATVLNVMARRQLAVAFHPPHQVRAVFSLATHELAVGAYPSTWADARCLYIGE